MYDQEDVEDYMESNEEYDIELTASMYQLLTYNIETFKITKVKNFKGAGYTNFSQLKQDVVVFGGNLDGIGMGFFTFDGKNNEVNKI